MWLERRNQQALEREQSRRDLSVPRFIEDEKEEAPFGEGAEEEHYDLEGE